MNKAPGNIGFLHLSLQEYLAARHLLQLSASEKISFVSANASETRWREPILYLLSMAPNEAEAGQLVEAIENAPATDAPARDVRDALLTDAVFADFAHDLGTVRRIAAKCFAEAELTAWGGRQRHLLSAAVDGLFSESGRRNVPCEISRVDTGQARLWPCFSDRGGPDMGRVAEIGRSSCAAAMPPLRK